MFAKRPQVSSLHALAALLFTLSLVITGCNAAPALKVTPTEIAIAQSPAILLDVKPASQVEAGQEVAIVAKVEPYEKLSLKWSVSGTSGGKLNTDTGEQVVYTTGQVGVDIVVAEGKTASGAPVKQTVALTIVAAPTPIQPPATLPPTADPSATATISPSASTVIDDMEQSSIPYWRSRILTDGVGISRLDLGSVPGRTDNAMEISYTLDKGGWALTSRYIDPQILSGTERIGFFYKADGPPNTLELKLEYAGDTSPIFATSQPLVSGTNEWVLFEVPYSALDCGDTCKPPGNKHLDLTQVARITIAVSNWRDGTPGSGKVIIDDLYMIK